MFVLFTYFTFNICTVVEILKYFVCKNNFTIKKLISIWYETSPVTHITSIAILLHKISFNHWKSINHKFISLYANVFHFPCVISKLINPVGFNYTSFLKMKTFTTFNRSKSFILIRFIPLYVVVYRINIDFRVVSCLFICRTKSFFVDKKSR